MLTISDNNQSTTIDKPETATFDDHDSLKFKQKELRKRRNQKSGHRSQVKEFNDYVDVNDCRESSTGTRRFIDSNTRTQITSRARKLSMCSNSISNEKSSMMKSVMKKREFSKHLNMSSMMTMGDENVQSRN